MWLPRTLRGKLRLNFRKGKERPIEYRDWSFHLELTNSTDSVIDIVSRT